MDTDHFGKFHGDGAWYPTLPDYVERHANNEQVPFDTAASYFLYSYNSPTILPNTRNRYNPVGQNTIESIAPTNAYETSKAAVYNSDMNIWMSNRFSIYLIETLKASHPTIREMFYYLSSHTLGSHASLYNYNNYDDITKAGFEEY